MREHSGRTQPSGFTLVELLVVIGIISVLLAILLPSLGLARRAAAQAVCASNLRQWAVALNLYVQENQGWLPRRGQGKQPTTTINWYDDWFNELPPLMNQPSYMDLAAQGRVPQLGVRSVWICPDADGVAPAGASLFCYAMNMALSVRNASQPDRINQIGPAASMVFMADGPIGQCSTLPYAPTPFEPGLFNPEPRHRGRVNIAFIDTHVMAYDAKSAGVGIGDPQRDDLRWYWYTPGPYPSPWTGP